MPVPRSQPPPLTAGGCSRRPAGGESGQAAVELVAVLPLVALVLALAWQAVLAGQTAWSATVAARAAARAAALDEDPVATARARLDHGVAPAAEVRAGGNGRVTVSVPVPAVVPGIHLGRVEAEGTFRPQTGR